MRKYSYIGVVLMLTCLLTACNNNTTETSDMVETTQVENTIEETKETDTKEEKNEDLITNIEDKIIGEEADKVGLDEGHVIGTDGNGEEQVTGVGFNGINGISTYNKDENGKITSYTMYVEDISNDFENIVQKAVDGLKKEVGGELQYEEVDVNEGKNGATTIEALKKGNLYCYYKYDEGTYIQIMGNNAGAISMIININNEVADNEETELGMTQETASSVGSIDVQSIESEE